MLAQMSAEIFFTTIFFQAYIRKQILQIENDPTLDDIEKARRKQVFMYFRSWCYNHVFSYLDWLIIIYVRSAFFYFKCKNDYFLLPAVFIAQCWSRTYD